MASNGPEGEREERSCQDSRNRAEVEGGTLGQRETQEGGRASKEGGGGKRTSGNTGNGNRRGD